MLVDVTTLDGQCPCSIENLSIAGSLKGKEHYEENTGILMTRDVGSGGKIVTSSTWDVTITLPSQLRCYVMTEANVLLASDTILADLFEKGFDDILEPTK